MSTTEDFIDYLLEQIDHNWQIRYRKMFGEYMVYINDKPILLVCDNTVFVKQLDCLIDIIEPENIGTPYTGAKEHFIVDIENQELLNLVIERLEPIIKVPVKKVKKKEKL